MVWWEIERIENLHKNGPALVDTLEEEIEHLVNEIDVALGLSGLDNDNQKKLKGAKAKLKELLTSIKAAEEEEVIEELQKRQKINRKGGKGGDQRRERMDRIDSAENP
jgi:hypothetical protein